MARLAEKIRGNTGNDFWIQIAVQAKQLTMHPDVGAVVVHEDRNIPDDADVPLAAVAPKITPLLVKRKLQGAAYPQVLGQFLTSLGHSRSLPMRQLMGPAFTIAALGAIESLLSAMVADGMAETRHDPNQELIGQGIANILSPLVGGIAATGAIARTAANIRNGAQTPVAAVIHSLVLLTVALVAGAAINCSRRRPGRSVVHYQP